MVLICTCGDELVVHVAHGRQTTYCQTCGHEGEQIVQVTTHKTPIISLTRASILKKIKDTTQQQNKKPKQIRDRTDYTKARRAR